MIENLWKSPHIEKIVEVQGDTIEFLKASMDEYQANNDKFRELLAILMMITGSEQGHEKVQQDESYYSLLILTLI